MFTAERDGRMLGACLAQRPKESSFLHCAFKILQNHNFLYIGILSFQNVKTFCMWEWRSDWMLKDKADCDGWFHAYSDDSMCYFPATNPSFYPCKPFFDIVLGGVA
jgi:hypothetical protein